MNQSEAVFLRPASPALPREQSLTIPGDHYLGFYLYEQGQSAVPRHRSQVFYWTAVPAAPDFLHLSSHLTPVVRLQMVGDGT